MLGPWIPAQGVVFRAYDQAFHVPRGSTSQTRTYASVYFPYDWDLTLEECRETAGTLYEAVVALPNDPAVTGVSGISFGTPIVFGVP